MIHSKLFTRLLLAGGLLAVPFAEGGCGQTACFTWSTQEGACPAQSEALAFFSDPSCPGRIKTVESGPTRSADGQLCCYAVLSRDESDQPGCTSGAGGNGFTTGSAGGGFSDTSFEAAATGQGGSVVSSSTGADTCERCSSVFGSTQKKSLCQESMPLFSAVITCVCSGACAMACGDNFCPGNAATAACVACIQDTSAGCGNDFAACANDI